MGFADAQAAVIEDAMAAVVEPDGDDWAVTISDLRCAGMATPSRFSR